MFSFLICLALLIGGYFVYGGIVEKTFGPDDRETPAVKINDGVDYMVLPQWKLFMIQLLNIAGLGPIFGALSGALWGPVVFLWITFGTIFAGAVHDYFSGMMSERNEGASISEISGIYLGGAMKNVMRVFSVVLLVMVGTVFAVGPAGLIQLLCTKGGSTGIFASKLFWLVLILVYYFIATFLSIDKIIGKIYPVFGICLIIMALGVALGIFTKGYEIPEGSRQSKGMNVVNLLPLMPGEKVSSMIRVPDFGEGDYYLCMVTRNGVIKRTELDAYKNIRKNGVIAINLDEGDELAWVKLTDGSAKLVLATKKGMCIAFDENDARSIGRTARGVKALNLKEGDTVVGMDILRDGGMVLTVSETGYGRLSEVTDYKLQNRGGMGTKNYHTAKYGDVAAIEVVDPADDLMLISSDGIIIRIALNNIRICSKPAKGVRVMKVSEGERLITAVSVPADGEEPVSELPEDNAEPEDTDNGEE